MDPKKYVVTAGVFVLAAGGQLLWPVEVPISDKDGDRQPDVVVYASVAACQADARSMASGIGGLSRDELEVLKSIETNGCGVMGNGLSRDEESSVKRSIIGDDGVYADMDDCNNKRKMYDCAHNRMKNPGDGIPDIDDWLDYVDLINYLKTDVSNETLQNVSSDRDLLLKTLDKVRRDNGYISKKKLKKRRPIVDDSL